jgi:hypothetical protein
MDMNVDLDTANNSCFENGDGTSNTSNDGGAAAYYVNGMRSSAAGTATQTAAATATAAATVVTDVGDAGTGSELLVVVRVRVQVVSHQNRWWRCPYLFTGRIRSGRAIDEHRINA